MLNKKNFVSKTIRFDERISNDLSILSNILERPQNELVNIAVEELIRSNKSWFAENIIVDYFKPWIDSGAEDIEAFDNENVKIWISYSENDDVVVNVRDEEEVFNRYFKDFDESYEKFLRELAVRYVDFNSQKVEKYLETRLNYK